MNYTKGSPQPVDQVARDRLIRGANELLTDPMQNPATVVSKMQFTQIREIPSASVFRSPSQPEAGEILVDHGDLGPRFTHFEDPWYRQQVANRAAETRILEKCRKHIAHEADLIRRQIRDAIRSGKLPLEPA